MPVPTHRIQIFKEYGGENWSNDYLVATTSIDTAEDTAVAALAMERQLTFTEVNFTYYLISTLTVGDRIFRRVPVNQKGQRSYTSAQLALFNTLRVDLSVTDSDTGRKFYRGVLLENDVAGPNVEAAAVAAFQAIVDSFFPTASATQMVTPAGNSITGAVVYPLVQMRQLHRKRRRLATTAA